MGLAGILLAPILLLFVRDQAAASARAHCASRQVFPLLARKPAFWLLAFAAS